MGRPVSPPGHLCGVSVGIRSTTTSWGPCQPAQKALKPSQEGLVWKKLSSSCPPRPQAISLPWLPALLNTRPGFPPSVKARRGFPGPPGASCSPGPAQGLEAAPPAKDRCLFVLIAGQTQNVFSLFIVLKTLQYSRHIQSLQSMI